MLVELASPWAQAFPRSVGLPPGVRIRGSLSRLRPCARTHETPRVTRTCAWSLRGRGDRSQSLPVRRFGVDRGPEIDILLKMQVTD